MRTLLRTAIIIGGTAAFAVVVLLALAAVTGSGVLALSAAALGAAMVIAGAIVATRIVDRLVAVTNGTATRLKNIEARAAGIVGRAVEFEELTVRRFDEVGALAADLEQVSKRLGAASGRIDAAEAEVAGLRVGLEGAGELVTRARGSVEENQQAIVELRAALRENRD